MGRVTEQNHIKSVHGNHADIIEIYLPDLVTIEKCTKCSRSDSDNNDMRSKQRSDENTQNKRNNDGNHNDYDTSSEEDMVDIMVVEVEEIHMMEEIKDMEEDMEEDQEEVVDIVEVTKMSEDTVEDMVYTVVEAEEEEKDMEEDIVENMVDMVDQEAVDIVEEEEEEKKDTVEDIVVDNALDIVVDMVEDTVEEKKEEEDDRDEKKKDDKNDHPKCSPPDSDNNDMRSKQRSDGNTQNNKNNGGNDDGNDHGNNGENNDRNNDGNHDDDNTSSGSGGDDGDEKKKDDKNDHNKDDKNDYNKDEEDDESDEEEDEKDEEKEGKENTDPLATICKNPGCINTANKMSEQSQLIKELQEQNQQLMANNQYLLSVVQQLQVKGIEISENKETANNNNKIASKQEQHEQFMSTFINTQIMDQSLFPQIMDPLPIKTQRQFSSTTLSLPMHSFPATPVSPTGNDYIDLPFNYENKQQLTHYETNKDDQHKNDNLLSEISIMLDEQMADINITTDSEFKIFANQILQENDMRNVNDYIHSCPTGNSEASKSTNKQDGNQQNQKNQSSQNDQPANNNNISSHGTGGSGKGRDDEDDDKNNKRKDLAKDDPKKLRKKKKKKKKMEQKPNDLDANDNIDENAINTTNGTCNNWQCSETIKKQCEIIEQQRQSFQQLLSTNAEQRETIERDRQMIDQLLSITQQSTDMLNNGNCPSNKKKNKKRQKKPKQNEMYMKIDNKPSYEPSSSRRARNNVEITRKITETIIPTKMGKNDKMNWYKYMDKAVAMQFNDNPDATDDGMVAIDCDLDDEKSQTSYYCIIEKQEQNNKENKRFKWKMHEKLYTKMEVKQISHKIPILGSSRKKLAGDLRQIDVMRDLFNHNYKDIMNDKWSNIAVYRRENKKYNKQRIVLCLQNEVMNEIIHKSTEKSLNNTNINVRY